MEKTAVGIVLVGIAAGIVCGCTNKSSKVEKKLKIEMVQIPGREFEMLKTEVTQKLYASVIDNIPSYFKEYIKDDNNPIVLVNWYDAIYFCNKLSEKFGYTPVYSVNGDTKTENWGYKILYDSSINGNITQNLKANGFRLPNFVDWIYAASGGQSFKYSGSDNLDEVGWYDSNSGDKVHPVAMKKVNGYGLYDMSGNVQEWCYDEDGDSVYGICSGGCYKMNERYSEVDNILPISESSRDRYRGFRIVCSASE